MSLFRGKVNFLFLLFTVFFFISQNLFALSGGFMGEKDIRITKTKYFDIIYAAQSEESAKILFENADDIFEEVAELFDTHPNFCLPIVIIPSVENLNAFFTSAPYNHIVLYDTSNSSLDELSSFSESFLEVFRHELSHAFTFNLKNNFWSVMGKIFGDVADLGYINITPGLAEGAAIVSESFYGEGRLNNEFFRHLVKQAKIEGSFPKFYDTQGSRDIYPVGLYYHFNGAFYDWLQKEYGMHKYALFWYKIVNFQKITLESAFKDVYGMKLKNAWKIFYEQYQVPALKANPLEENPLEEKITGGNFEEPNYEEMLVRDFFEPNERSFSMQNSRGALYSSLSYGDGKFFYLDSASSQIFYTPFKVDSLSSERYKAKVFTNISSAQSLSLSQDGKYLALSYYSSLSSAVKAKVCLYDLNKKNYITLPGHGQKDAAIIQNGNDYFLVCHNYIAPNNVIEIYKVIFSNAGDLKTFEKYKEIKLDLNVFAASFTQAPSFNIQGNLSSAFYIKESQKELASQTENSFAEYGINKAFDGTFAYIQKNRLNYSICIRNIDGKLIAEYEVPYKDMFLKDLSYSQDGSFIFNYVQKGTMPRYGKLVLKYDEFSEELEKETEFKTFGEKEFDEKTFAEKNLGDATFMLSKRDLSGGIFSPIEIEDTIYYIGNFFKENRILKLAEKEDFEIHLAENKVGKINISYEDESVDESKEINLATLEKSDSKTSLFTWERFHGINYFFKGIFIPLSIYQSSSSKNEDFPYFAQFYPLGITYVTGMPWSNGSNSLALFTVGYGPFSNAMGAELQLQSATETSLLSSLENFKFEADGNGVNLFLAEQTLSSVIPFAHISYFFISNTLSANYEKQRNLPYFLADETFRLIYSNIHKTGSGRFEKAGVSLGAGFSYKYGKNLNRGTLIFDNPVLAFYTTLSLPQLLPFSNFNGFTYNLPFTLSATLFPSSSTYAGSEYGSLALGTSVLDIDAKLVLLGFEIQKALPAISAIYVNNFYISGGYSATITAYKNSKTGFQLQYMNQYFGGLVDGSSLYLDSVYVTMSLGLTPNYGILTNRSFKFDLYSKFRIQLMVLFDENSLLQ